MDVKIPERDKRPGVYYAVTDSGVELPIIDVSHPAFAVHPTERELDAMRAQFVAETERREKLPKFVQRLLLGFFLRGSVLGRGLRRARGGFLDGLSTYLFKLGSENLGSGWAVPVDRKIAASLPVLSMRLRLQDMARFLAEGLAALLTARPEAPLQLVNIAGGPAMDDLNALILLRQRDPTLLAGRSIVISVLDLESAAPAFGARALTALQSAGAPLAGLDVRFEHVAYDWHRTHTLAELLQRAAACSAVVAISSEGGLFEYGSDQAITDNLMVLREGTPSGTFFVGSVTRGDGAARYLHRGSDRAATRPRSLDAFRALILDAGWGLERSTETLICYDVCLVKQPGSTPAVPGPSLLR